MTGNTRMTAGTGLTTGLVVALWGPTGAPGVSTVAAALAGELAADLRVILVDANLTRGALGVVLKGDGGGNIVSATRFPAPRGAACAPGQLQEHRAGFRLLPGLPGPAQGLWVEPAVLVGLLERLRGAADLVLVDVGARLVVPPGGMAAPPTDAGSGHAAALAAADVVLVVARATRLGVSDLLLQYPLLDQALARGGRRGAAARWCVLNNGSGRRLRQDERRITAALGRGEDGRAPLRVLAYLPHHHEAVEEAEERGLPVTTARPDSPLSRAIRPLADRLAAACAGRSSA